jgi:hypothetical protein
MYPRRLPREKLQQFARDTIEQSTLFKFNVLPAWFADTMPTDFVSSWRKVANRANFVCAFHDEGDVMEGEKISLDEALASRFESNERSVQVDFLRQFFEEKRDTKPEYNAAGDRKSQFAIDDSLGQLTVDGIIWDEIVSYQEPFVDSLATDWTHSTRLIVAIGKCKEMVSDSQKTKNPYTSMKDG